METLKRIWSELSAEARAFLTGALIGASSILVLAVLWSVLF